MTTNYHTAISVGAAANAATFNTPLGALDAAITNAQTGMYNVLEYGATGNGVAEDADNIQAAIDAAAAAGGGPVFLPAGTYLCNTELQVKDDVSLIGHGIGVTIITTGATLANGVINIWNSGAGSGSGADNVTLRDFTLEGNGEARINADLGGFVRGIRSLYGPENLLIQRVKVNDGGERAIEINQPINCRITDCIVTGTSTILDKEGDAIHCEGTNEAIQAARNIIIDGCIVEDWGDCAIATTACNEVVISNNVIRGAAAFGETAAADETGIDMTGVRNGICTNNKIYGIKRVFVGAISNSAGAGFESRDITISNNVFAGYGTTHLDYGVRVGSADDAITTCGNYVISGNIFKNTYYAAIGVDKSTNTSITGNVIVDADLAGDGSALDNCAIMLGIDLTKIVDSVTCCGNTIIDTGGNLDTGIYVNAANTKNVVYGNFVYGSSVTNEVLFVGAQRATTFNAMNVIGGIDVNVTGADLDTRIQGDTDANLLFVDAGANAVGIGHSYPQAKLHIDQHETAYAKPVLTLDQADVSEAFIKLIGESTTDNSQSLVDAADLEDPGAIVGWFKVYIEDVQGTNPITDGVYWVPFYATPTHSA